MAQTQSRIFQQFIADIMNNTTAIDINTDALIEVALFDNSITPDPTVSAANSAYGAGVWASGGVSSGTDWPALGRPLVSTTSVSSAGTYTMDAADTASATAGATLTAYGCLIYDKTITTPVSGQGICFIWFGGAASVSTGTFTVVWSSSGIMSLVL